MIKSLLKLFQKHSRDPQPIEAVTPLCENPRTCLAIEKLPYEVILNIFRRYLNISPQGWPTLMHVSGGWRHIVLASPLGLRLRLYCTHGTPVLKNLDFWPPFPLVVSYGGHPMLHPPAPEDDENIMAALKQSDRVGSIGLTVTNSLLKNLLTISDPFPILEELVLLSRSNVLTLPSSALRWGPRLRILHLTSFPIPTLLQHLPPSTGLVDLQLHEIPSVGYFTPDAFANALSELAQLETLSLHFLTLPPRRNFVGLPPHPSTRVTLPALTCLKYRGTSTYLNRFVARIDAPRLGDIGITFFGQPTMDASQLGRFIERIETLTSLDRADIQTSARAISICCSRPGTPAQLKLQISWEQLDWQLSCLTQVCDHFSPFLHRVQVLGISSAQSLSEKADMDGQQWRDLIHVFGGAKDFRVIGAHVTDILWALCSSDDAHATDTALLPSLNHIFVQDYIPTSGPLSEATRAFITSRRISGRPVEFHILKGGASEVWNADDESSAWFTAIDQGGSGQISAEDLQNALIRRDGRKRFSPAVVEYLMSVFDLDGSGKIGFEEFKPLWDYFKQWREMFESFDDNQDGFIDAGELSNALRYYNLQVGPLVINFIIHEYGAPHGHNGPPQIELDRFICACVVVQQMSALYDRCAAGRATPMEVSRDDFLLAIFRLPGLSPSPVGITPPPGNSSYPSWFAPKSPPPIVPRNPHQEECYAWFVAIDQDGSGEISPQELHSALMNDGGLKFSISTVKYLMSIFDLTGSSELDLKEFEALWIYITQWRQMFESFDIDHDGKIDADELGQALAHHDLRVDSHVLNMLVRKYAAAPPRNRSHYSGPPPRPQLDLDRFLCACVIVREMCQLYDQCSTDRATPMEISRDDFIRAVISLPCTTGSF